jgi:ATP-dependent RNA helicase DDX51/DBP6
VQILVASDAMTRGMDVAGITAVVNYDTPVYAKTYVHRAGKWRAPVLHWVVP